MVAKSSKSSTRMNDRLRMVLNSWVARGTPGAKELRDQLHKLPTIDAKNEFLEKHVVPNNVKKSEQTISNHSQAHSVEIDSFKRNVVVKSYVHHSIALKRTLAIYGFFREQCIEEDMPVAPLLSVTKDARFTRLTFVNMGPDCKQHLPVTRAVFRSLRIKAEEKLHSAGLTLRISHHLANWVMHGGPDPKVYLVDLGKCSLDPARTGRMSMRVRTALKKG